MISAQCTMVSVRTLRVAQRCGGASSFVLSDYLIIPKEKIGFRFKSSEALSAGCPFHNPVAESVKPIKLNKVPALPLIGSMISAHSGMAKFELSSAYDFWAENYKRFGGFYSAGFPFIGNDICGCIVVVTDPNEFLKVLRKEGPLPFGAIQTDWPFYEFFKDKKSPGAHLFTRNENWKRLRRFMQTDLLSPQAAKGYVPGIVEAAQLASNGIDQYTEDLSSFMSRVSFDLFSSVMFGELTNLAAGTEKDPNNVEFCQTSQNAFSSIVPILLSASSLPLKKLGIKTKKYQYMERELTRSRDLVFAKLQNFRERKQRGQLNERELASYASLSIDRELAARGTDESVSEQEVSDVFVFALTAAIDTTTALLSWCLVHLAMNPQVQEKLYQEISHNVMTNPQGPCLTEAILTHANAPYLHKFFRENHRLTPPLPISLIKYNATGDVELHGESFSRDTLFLLDARSAGMDPNILGTDRVDAFEPERWLDDAVQNRVGTPAEILDHPLYRDPFSAGSRKCPGSRVANYEALVVISQLILDWNISFPDADVGKYKTWRDIPYNQGMSVPPSVPALKFEKRVLT